jgi:hypothetical protein
LLSHGSPYFAVTTEICDGVATPSTCAGEGAGAGAGLAPAELELPQAASENKDETAAAANSVRVRRGSIRFAMNRFSTRESNEAGSDLVAGCARLHLIGFAQRCTDDIVGMPCIGHCGENAARDTTFGDMPRLKFFRALPKENPTV